MKKIIIIIFCIVGLTGMSFTIWPTDFEKAKLIAKEKHELILLNFSGSDWCGPCMRMKKEFFEDRIFLDIADSDLVLVNADFPRNKKNKLDEITTKKNESLADKYNPEGKFPLTLLLDADGKIITTWDGLPKGNVAQFTQQIKILFNAQK